MAAIFLPLGFLTGLLGTTSHRAFWITCGAMAALAALQFVIFRKLRWL